MRRENFYPSRNASPFISLNNDAAGIVEKQPELKRKAGMEEIFSHSSTLKMHFPVYKRIIFSFPFRCTIAASIMISVRSFANCMLLTQEEENMSHLLPLNFLLHEFYSSKNCSIIRHKSVLHKFFH